jgi:DNA replication protein DnaC
MKNLALNFDLLRDAAIPKAFWGLGAETYWGDKRALDLANNYIESCFKVSESGVSLVFAGPHASCKTFLVTYILRCLMVRRFDVKYSSLDQLTNRYFDKTEGLRLEREVSAPDFLGLDGVDQTDKGGAALVLDQILRYRKDHRLPVVLATSMKRDAFEQAFKPSTVEFVYNQCIWVDVKLDQIKKDAHFRLLKRVVPC